MAFEKVLAISLLFLFFEASCSQNGCHGDNCTDTSDIHLMEKIDASLKAELDLSTWNKQIRRLIKAEVRGERKRGNITLPQENTDDHATTNTVGFHAQLTKDITLGSAQTVIFDKVITNIGNAYNLNTGHFTAPYDGAYYFASTFLESGNSYLHLQMIRNSDEISRGHAPSTTSGAGAGSMNAFVLLKKGDVVFVRHYVPAGAETIHASWTFFTGYLVSKSS